LEDLRTVVATPKRTGERALSIDEFGERAGRALALIEDSARSKTLWTWETDNIGDRTRADIVMCGDPGGDQGDRVGELVLPDGDRSHLNSMLHHLGWNAEQGRLAIVVHAPFAGHRGSSLAFAAKLEERGDYLSIHYLVRLFLYPSEAGQWRP